MQKAAGTWLVAATVMIGLNASGWAEELQAGQEDFQTGQVEYMSNCAQCHGVDGKGQGPLALKLKTKPADLTAIAKRNNGVFPLNAIYQTIDGRSATGSHGARDMPIWGCRYEAAPIRRKKGYKPKPTEQLLNLPCDSEAVIGRRILAIVGYLSQIQER
jgi:mono/diheme cytochrome c family protein